MGWLFISAIMVNRSLVDTWENCDRGGRGGVGRRVMGVGAGVVDRLL